MRYAVVMPGIGTADKGWTREQAEQALEVAKALGVTDAWITAIGEVEEAGEAGEAGEGC